MEKMRVKNRESVSDRERKRLKEGEKVRGSERKRVKERVREEVNKSERG